jgi:hypothetical protein
LFPQPADQRQDNFTHRDRIFSGLDIEICNAGGAMVDQQIGKVVQASPKSVQTPIVPAHAAVNAVLAAEIGEFDDTPHEDTGAEMGFGCFSRSTVKFFLFDPAAP